jgi:hypothetical protein
VTHLRSISRLGHPGLPRRLRDAAHLLIVILSLNACAQSTGVKQCGPEKRVASVRGALVIGDGTSYAGLSLAEVREPGRPETELATIYVFAQSDSLRTHMTRAELRDSQTPSRLFGSYAPPAVLPLPPNLFSFDGPYPLVLPVEEFRALMVSGQLVLDILTDLPAQPLVRIPLTILVQNDPSWGRMTGEGCG